jgi:hypothetical protein
MSSDSFIKILINRVWYSINIIENISDKRIKCCFENEINNNLLQQPYYLH